MPLKLNVGLSKKVGLPDYGSLGASCHVEVELEASLVFQDLTGFHERVRQAFAACNQALHEELTRQQQGEAARCRTRLSGGGHTYAPANDAPVALVDGAACESHASPAASQPAALTGRSLPRRATDSQVRALRTIAERRQFELATWLRERHGVAEPSDLTLSQASHCLDELNGPRRRKAE
ncbi:MAG: hypothetical protein U0939_22010 [Pirellulales bacterium]